MKFWVNKVVRIRTETMASPQSIQNGLWKPGKTQSSAAYSQPEKIAPANGRAYLPTTGSQRGYMNVSFTGGAYIPIC